MPLWHHCYILEFNWGRLGEEFCRAHLMSCSVWVGSPNLFCDSDRCKDNFCCCNRNFSNGKGGEWVLFFMLDQCCAGIHRWHYVGQIHTATLTKTSVFWLFHSINQLNTHGAVLSVTRLVSSETKSKSFVAGAIKPWNLLSYAVKHFWMLSGVVWVRMHLAP